MFDQNSKKASREQRDKQELPIALRILFEIVLFLLDSSRLLGTITFRSFKKAAKVAALFYQKYLRRVTVGVQNLLKAMQSLLVRMAYAIRNSVMVVFNFIPVICEDITVAYQEKEGEGKWNQIKYLLKKCLFGIGKNHIFLTTAVNYALPALAIVLVVQMVSSTIGTTYAIEVNYNGTDVGYIANESTYEQANMNLQQRLTYVGNDQAIEATPIFTVKAVNEEQNEKIVNSAELTDQMLRASNEDIVQADGLYIDGKFIGAVKEIGVLQKKLDSMLSVYQAQKGVDKVYFLKDLKVEEGFYLAENIKPLAEITELLDSQEQAKQIYTVKKGDSPIMIAKKNSISYSELKKLNPDIEKNLPIGRELTISVPQPFLSIAIVKTETYSEKIAYKTTERKTEKQPRGYEKVTQKGKNGKRRITAEVEYVNGVEQGRKIVSNKVISKAVPKKVVVGTGTYYARTTRNGTSSGGLSFTWPLPGGYVSSSYGMRGGYIHTGMDIAMRGGAYGKPIVAAGSGTVVFAGWYSTYGKIIEIDHGNGLQTWYAHCSSFDVGVGERVSQGQVIARVGTTGYVTGPHVHFEVRVGGAHTNPYNFF